MYNDNLKSSIARFHHAQVRRIRAELDEMRGKSIKAIVTSSFQSQSLPLLHILSENAPYVPVAFLDTGFHFPETLDFRDQVVRLLQLRLINLRPNKSKHKQRDKFGRLLFTTDPDECCFLNKVEPLNALLKKYDVWITGIRRDQSARRSAMQRTEGGPSGTIRYHPMIDWDARSIYLYRLWHHLPSHPLESLGYGSIGCMPCTTCISSEGIATRSGRWKGLNKSECGLHTTMVERSPEE